MFENKLSSQGIHYSRYIASWYRSGGDFGHPDWDGFIAWAMSTGVTREEAVEMHKLASNGKMELESSAKLWIARFKKTRK